MKRITLITIILLSVYFGLQSQFQGVQKGMSVNNELLLDVSYHLDEDSSSPKFTVTGKILSAKNLDSGSVVSIYSVLGDKVYSFVYAGNPVTLNLNKGIYIIRVNKFTQKIIL